MEQPQRKATRKELKLFLRQSRNEIIRLKKQFLEQDQQVFRLKLTEEEVRLAAEGKHENQEVNQAVAKAIKMRQKIVDLVAQRALVKNRFEKNKAQNKLDNTPVELEENQVPSSEGIIELSKQANTQEVTIP